MFFQLDYRILEAQKKIRDNTIDNMGDGRASYTKVSGGSILPLSKTKMKKRPESYK